MASEKQTRLPDNSRDPGAGSPEDSPDSYSSYLTSLASSQPSLAPSIVSASKSDENRNNFADPSSRESNVLTGNDPVKLITTINDFYAHLDRQPYLKDFKLKESSKIHFSRLLQKLINTPPVVADETDDLFTLLKNTAHFFRILGKDNIVMLKGILDREKSSFENILKTFYTLTGYPETLAREYSLTLPRDALYDYAGFFLNTIGGRLYLFRRDSISRMTVSFYSILLIDKANNEGANRFGIDLRPFIDSLLNEIENTGNSLLLKEEYLDALYDLKEKYN